MSFLSRLFRKKPQQTERKPEVKPVEVPEQLNMKLSRDGLVMIASFEGFSSEPYLCQAGVPTIGYGSIYRKDGSAVSLSDSPVTKKEALELLDIELQKYVNVLNKTLPSYGFIPSQAQFDVLVSFSLNLGIGVILNPSSELSVGIKNGTASRALLSYNKYKKKIGFFYVTRISDGLTIRRLRESRVFESGMYELTEEDRRLVQV